MNIQIRSQSLTLLINHRGAELCSVKNQDQLEFIWRGEKDIWPRHAPVLFPIVGKLKKDKYQLHSQWYNMTQHGFARDMDFELVQHADNSCTFELRADSESRKQYPFEFIFQISYQLHENCLSCTYRIVNLSQTSLPFSVGAHPGFNCPLLPGETFEDYYIKLEQSEFLLSELDQGLRLPRKKPLYVPHKKLPLSKELFDNDALVFEGNQIDSVKLCSSRSAHSVQLNCKGWPYFGIWSKKGCNKFVCLEPWHGIADAAAGDQRFSGKEGLIHLQPNQEVTYEYSLSFS